MSSISWDDADFLAHMASMTPRIKEAANKGVDSIAQELLRLSQVEVPHDKGTLQNSGEWHHSGELEASVGYHTPYAHRLHEHPEYNFQDGRKGKYLESPMKNNLTTFRQYFVDKVREAF